MARKISAATVTLPDADLQVIALFRPNDPYA
jgi:hypothetical protein